MEVVFFGEKIKNKRFPSRTMALQAHLPMAEALKTI